MNKVLIKRKFTGFTLIEVIIAMTILSLILVLLFSTIFTANKTWQSTETKITKNDELRLAGHFIQKQITQNIPLIWIDQKKQKLIFEGKNDELRFTASLPAHRGGGGVQVILLKINESDDGQNLVLFYRYADPDSSPIEIDSDELEQTTLIENIKSIELAYFGQEKITEDPKWKDEWQNNEVLPLLISLKIHAVDESQNWPELKIPLRVNYVKGQPQFSLRKAKNAAI